MLSLENQIRELADYAFETSEAVQFEPHSRESVKKRGLASSLLTVAAVIAIVGGGIGISRQLRQQTETINPTETVLEIDDPLNINLDPLIETSAQVRVKAVGAYTTFDFDQLPEGWSAEQNFAVTMSGFPATFWQQVLVSGPGSVRLVVNVTGALHGSVSPGFDPTTDSRPDVRDQPFAVVGGALSWIENGASQVEIVNRGSVLLDPDDAIDLAELLVPVVTELDWQLEPRFGPGTPPANTPTQLSGLVDGIAWNVVLASGQLLLLSGPEFADVGGGSQEPTHRTRPESCPLWKALTYREELYCSDTLQK